MLNNATAKKYYCGLGGKGSIGLNDKRVPRAALSYTWQQKKVELQYVKIEFRQGPFYVVNFRFSRCPDRC